MTDAKRTETVKVLYNADCPVCSLEIDHYARITDKNGLEIAFDDLNDRERLSDWGIDEETAAKRLHVLMNGVVLSGIPAFVALWREMPSYRWLAHIVGMPGVYHVAVWTYDAVLAPLLYRWHLRRIRVQKST